MTLNEQIKAKYIRLSKGQKIVAQYIIKQPKKITTESIARISEEIGVSESTIVRFCYAIDVNGFVALQERLRQDLKNPQVQQVESVLW
ncbi:DNA-binding transcriptional regulator HexR [Metalysinibacillus saudimassiliensis]|uniref:DNA-binding transcriptional regulator HexR n=1 Tax=Metalysinibacillus saudimassiliensis TaxID=1461583 RepID=A0A078MA30_9BACL|nr:DNA-binding transcriptional regulator HexR [Metalysinibacillus saudimassiliensis]